MNVWVVIQRGWWPLNPTRLQLSFHVSENETVEKINSLKHMPQIHCTHEQMTFHEALSRLSHGVELYSF
jgi:hypothetical protein